MAFLTITLDGSVDERARERVELRVSWLQRHDPDLSGASVTIERGDHLGVECRDPYLASTIYRLVCREIEGESA